jgi:ketosteroid isomerase-like protein
MTQENVEGVRRGFDCLARGDLEGLFALLDPDIIWHQPSDLPDRVTARGHAELGTIMGRWIGEWDNYRVELEELIDAGDCVVAVQTIRGKGKGSGVETQMREAHVYKVQDGRAVEVWEYRTKEEALSAVGLSGSG